MSNMNVLMHNTTAMFSNRQLGITNKDRAKSSEKLTSGYKINRAADDAAGLTISENMRYYIRGLRQGSKNLQDGISLCQVADGALNEVHDMIHRLSELAIKGANGTLTDDDRAALESENVALKDEMRRIFNTTEFNGHKIFVAPYTPEVSGTPTDFEVFNLDVDNKGLSGGDSDIRYGGLELNNIRFTWEELGLDKYLSEDGKTWDFTTNTSPEAQVLEINLASTDKEQYKTFNGEDVIIRITQGEELPNLERVYTWKADDKGIYINNLFAKSWEDLGVTENGKEDGEIQFTHNGVTYNFLVGEDNKQDIIAGVNGDLSDGHIFKAGLSDTPSKQAVEYSFGIPKKVTESSVNSKTIAEDDYKIVANKDGITIVAKDDRDADSNVEHTRIPWDEFFDTKAPADQDLRNTITDFGLENIDNNDDKKVTNVIQTFSENAVYHYKDEATGIEFDFTIRDESSYEAIINSLNNNDIQETYTANGSAPGTTSTLGETITITSNSVVGQGLSSFRMQKELDRNFGDGTNSYGFDFNVSKKVENVTGQSGPIETNRKTGPSVIQGSENSVSTTVIDGGDGNGDIFTLYTKKQDSWKELTINTNIKSYTQNVSFDYTGSYGTEALVVADNNSHTIRYDDTMVTRTTDSYTQDTYIELGKLYKETVQDAEGNDIEVWKLRKNDGTVEDYAGDVSGLSTVTDEDLTKTTKELQSTSDQITKTRSVTNSSQTEQDGLRVSLDYAGNTDRHNSEYLSEDPASNPWLFNATYKTTIGEICSNYLENYGPDDYGKVITAQSGIIDTSTLTITASPVEVRYSAVAETRGNRSVEPEYARLKSIVPEKELILQAGDDEPNDITLNWHCMNLSSIGLSGTTMKSQYSCKAAISQIQDALDLVSEERSIFGAHQNRLEHAIRINDNTRENLETAESRIRDTDMAEESVRYAKEGILMQAGQSMLAQANQSRQGILSLLQ